MAISLKTLHNLGFSPDESRLIREAIQRYERKYPFSRPRPVHTMEKINSAMGGFGVETIPSGSNSRSPEITYVNMGDTYSTTILFVNGNFRVGSWGDIVERGNYA